ncbi:RHS repeat-associated core domain-containing protein [Comamonas odontotermitis]|uniref:RHS repeat-associated core domain-containing protein n=1 Tax=Comamonas odontotermitis TaxID=379895 RepID=UPI001CC4D55F|nr:RHS repeat-associated core domain-containing protein [Comamonas odontotermitis]UBB17180.1 hypothetical protein LAD35_00520 [Comamonas odontotermitis]
MPQGQTTPISAILDWIGQRSERFIRLWVLQLLAIAIALYACFPSTTFAQTIGSQRYTLYIDTDGGANSGTTGCSATVQDASGSQSLSGIDYQVHIDTTQDAAGATVNAVTLASCSNNAWGSPAPVESGARKLPSTTAAGKVTEHIEAAIPMAQLGVKPGQYLTLNVGASGDYLISPVSGQGNGSIGLTVPNPQASSATPVPLMSAALIAALAAAMAVAGWWGIKTGRIKGNAVVAICTIVLASSALVTGVVSAANALSKLSIHDTSIADWAGISALATDSEGDNVLNTPDLMALYGVISDGQLFIRIDANAGRTDGGGPIVSGNRDVSPFEKASDLPRFVSVPGLTAQVNADWKYQVRAVDSHGTPVTVEVVGASTPAGVTISGAAPEQMVRWAPSNTGMHRITLLARDGNGKTQTQQFLLGVNDDGKLPPDPKTRATPLPPNVLTSFKDSTKFLYDDTDPIQKDVAAGTIDPIRAAVLRGRILDKNGNPLAGATIKIQGHPEYGYTQTRVDGWFDMAVNGGGWLTVHVEKTGYLSAQRKVNTPWRDWAFADDVVLIPFDNQYSQIDLTRNELQTYWGGENTDYRGARRTTIVFPAGTKAVAEMADGSTQNLEQLTVRVSEYTIGENGPQTMPGELPTTVGYTWAANFSADEAQALGAKHVRFNQPVHTYTNNFIQAPVGTAVPAGWYDFERTAWIGSDNGRVVQILSIEAGQAVLRITEADRAATSAELAQLGITADELKALAQMYPVGTQLWRTPMTHFTPWDCNWPWGPPPDAPPPPDDEPPSDGPPPTTPPDDNPPDPDNPDNEEPPPGLEEDIECGCDIYVKQRAVGQSIALRGTPFDLYYRSDKRLDIGQPVVAPTKIRTRIKSAAWVPNSALRYAQTDFSFAGRRIVRARSAAEFASTPQFDESSWDGKDIYGRRVTGGVATLRSLVKYGYAAVYYSSPADFARAFDTAKSASSVSFSRGGGQDPTIEIQSTRAAKSIKAPPENSFDVSQANMGGWSLRGLRLYDPDKQILHEAGGQLQAASKMAVAVQSVSDTKLPYSSQLRLLSDGGILMSEGHRVLMQHDLNNASSPPSVFAGQSEAGYSGDGGPAIDAKFNSVGATAEAADGSIYIADIGNRRLRRVSPNGIINTIAGNGGSDVSLPLGVPVRAVDAAITVRSMAPLPDMSVLLTTGLGELARLTPSGMLIRLDVSGPAKVVGSTNGQAWVLVTANPSINVYRYTQAGALEYVAVLPSYLNAASGPASNLLMQMDDEISTLDPNGKIRLISKRDASSGNFFSNMIGFNQDLGVMGMDYQGRIGRLSAGMPYLDQGVYRVGKPDGKGYEIFEADGRPVTYNSAFTGEALATYQYNAQGYLTSVTDGFGNVATWQRDSNDRATKVIGTDGQETLLAYNSQGQLASVTEPGGATHKMVYNGQGLLTEYHDPSGGVDRYSYDGTGKLVSNNAPDGSGWRLTRDNKTNTITATTAEGRSKSVKQLAQGSTIEKTSIGFDGGQTSYRDNLITGASVRNLPNGTSIDGSSYPDYQFGSVASMPSYTLKNGNLLNSFSERRAGIWGDRNFKNWISTSTQNNISWVTRFENQSYGPRLTSISPAGDRTFADLNELMQPVRVTVPFGADFNLEYNQKGLLQEINTYAYNEPTRTTKWQYHPYGSNGGGQVSQMTNALGQTTLYSYDAAGRASRVTLPDGRSAVYNYDAMGNLTQLVTPSGSSHRFGYTAAQQLANYNAPDTSTTWTYNRDRQPTQIRRPGGQTITFGYDAAARLSTIGSDAGSTAVQYDTVGQLASQEANGTRLTYLRTDSVVTGFEWSGGLNASYSTSVDSYGRPNKISLSAGTAAPITVPVIYDTANRIKTMGPLSIVHASEKNQVAGGYIGNYASSFDYNAFGEVVGMSYTGNAPSSPEDDATRVLLLQKIRSLSGELLAEISRRDTCRLRGWPILTSFYGGEVWEWVWTYDTPGLDAPKRNELISTYGAAQPRNPDYCLEVVRSQLADIEAQASSSSPNYSWASGAKDQTIALRTTTASGAVAVSALGNNRPDAGVITDSSSYNTAAVTGLYAEVLQLLDDLQQANYRYAFPAKFSYERDLLGRIAKQQERVLGAARAHSYVYDSAGRLITHTAEEGGSGTTSTAWGYDANGNRTHENGTLIATYDSEDRLQTWKGNTYQYNAAGDLQAKTTAAGATSYQYDSLGNLRSVGLPGGVNIAYVIDPQNRRIGKQKNGVMQYGLIYQNQLRPIAQTGPDGTIRSVFLYGERSNAPSGMLKDGKTYRIISDHLGSVRVVIDTATGEVKQQLSYDIWGNVTEDTNPNFQPFGFAGGLYDPDTGLTRFGARDYDAETGRWTAKDPILFEGGDTNLYGYVLQDPVNYIDPEGLQSDARPRRPGWPEWAQPKQPNRNCATAECAAGLLPAPSENRSQKEVEYGQCKLICTIVLSPPVAACNAIAGGGVIGTGLGIYVKKEICSSICK